MDNLELVNTFLAMSEKHKEELLQQMKVMAAFTERRFNWVDRGQMRLEKRMSALEDASNHKYDALSDLLDFQTKRGDLVILALTQKADKTDLISSWGFRVLNNRLARWAFGSAIAGMAAWLLASQWFMEMLKFLGWR